jgi:hypothetical protein
MFDFFGDDLDEDEELDGDEELDEDEEDAFGAELAEETVVYCPYCGQAVEMTIDASGGETQEYVEDCEICCQPWSVRVTIERDGTAHVDVQALDE